ncbi:hypothetical protein BK703_30690 [Bacillus thuringiensis serovar silo]|nr:hypothetical protein [Bacillus thuringiensis]MEB8858736.1 hypothetical protein [Bacillus cereus]MEC2466221.1 hypothetical protein [Bacillus cereus]MRC87627.1 hypothetical protein [Bacillus thuringiensis]OTW47649.1 hypothetical protein BK703_30690 [Bacillus thuringiensis serovar silo]OTW66814.1 hypothetical protein BK700_09580 [Bacillus thuringiensis serovar toguchini]
MSYFGQVDKKSIVYILDNEIASLKDRVVESDGADSSSLWIKFNRLEKLLYGEGRTLLSMTNKMKFESRLNTIRKRLNKFK